MTEADTIVKAAEILSRPLYVAIIAWVVVSIVRAVWGKDRIR